MYRSSRATSRLAFVAIVAASAMAIPTAGLAASQRPPPPVVGAGTINVPVLAVRSAPNKHARVVERFTEFRAQDYRPSYVLALALKKGTAATKGMKARKATSTRKATKARRASKGTPDWYKITIPGRPNGRTGWVQAAHVAIRPMPWQIVVFRGTRVIQVWKGKELVNTARVAVGAPGMETPTGIYYVTVRFKPVKDLFLGAFAFETSAYSKLSDWPGGGRIGLHGWSDLSVLGKAVSHGCIRVSNETASFLRDRIPLGTPIRVVAT